MAIILNIETSTNVCSVSLADDDKLLACQEISDRNSHSSVITIFIKKVLEEAKISINDIDAVAVSKGPGSYTGLRIGVSVAKGICYAIEKPLLAIDTMQSMAYGLIENKTFDNKQVILCPMLDARRMEVYCALYNIQGNSLDSVSAKIIDDSSFENYLENNIMYFFGDGSEKCKEIINHKNAFFISSFEHSSKNMIRISMDYFNKSKFENLAYFEPYYLKDFVAGKPRIKGLYS